MTNRLLDARFSVIGVGPGNPELLTLMAVRLIAEADVIAYPTTADGVSRARQTAADHITAAHEELAFHLPMHVDPAPAQAVYDRVAKDIGRRLDGGLSVALLCEGDPFFYGSAMHIYARLAAEHRIRVVPGVSSLTAGAAAAGLPLASRHDILKVLPATLDEPILAGELVGADAAVIIKVGRHFAKVKRVIEAAGLEDRAVLVAAAMQEGERVLRLAEATARSEVYFSMVLVSRLEESRR